MVNQSVELIRVLLTLLARRRGVAIAISAEFTTEEFLNALRQLELNPGHFFEELSVLEQEDGEQLKTALEPLLESGVDLERALETYMPKLPEPED